MGRKYCVQCKEVVETKVLGDYSQIELRGIAAKMVEEKIDNSNVDKENLKGGKSWAIMI
jgi:hypothetical protein